MKLWQCSSCGKVSFWSPTHRTFSNLIIDDEFPDCRVVSCSDACMVKLQAAFEDGKLQLPKLNRRNSPLIKISKGPVGYSKQPSQKELAQIWNKHHPDEQLNINIA